MKWYHIAHVVLTLMLAVAVVVFGVLWTTGVIGLRRPSPDAATVAEAKARLLVVRGLRPGWEYPIFEGTNIIGRADQQPVEIDLQPQEPDDQVWSSRQHAAITCESDSMVIEDLNSANGTYVNRSIVHPGTKLALKTGDIIQIGGVQLKVMQ